ncbi:male-enhanced antigen 1 [Harmonia axyridis]|uniref:male-enhanced antigen 1 n=1 Tax=Harmonia axyridis TaxID=115357 RepID=UPI001E277BB1|nr:male-enhanced antigen 1 [Harmonia axyridis]
MVYTNPIVQADVDKIFGEDPIAAFEAESADILHGGYEPLPQEPECSEDLPARSTEFDDIDKGYCPLRDDERNIDTFYYYITHPQPPTPRDDPTLPLPRKSFPLPVISRTSAYDDYASSSSSNINMDDKKCEEVKKIMVNINLPTSCIPEWAADVPEEQWKDFILQRLHLKKSTNFIDE